MHQITVNYSGGEGASNRGHPLQIWNSWTEHFAFQSVAVHRVHFLVSRISQGLFTFSVGKSTVAIAVVTTVVTGLPVFLISAMFLEISKDFDLPLWILGLIVACHWLSASVVSPAAGPLERAVGGDRLGMIAVALAMGSLMGASLLTSDWRLLFLWAILGGSSTSLAQPALNHLIRLRVSARHRAFAFGAKQAAVPISSLLSGVALPVIAVAFGWQWTFAGGAIFASVLLVIFLLRKPTKNLHSRKRGSDRLRPDQSRFIRSLGWLCLLGAGAASATVSFAVATCVTRGIDVAVAGAVLATGSFLSGILRVILGILADKGGNATRTIAIMQVIGAIGLLITSLPGQTTCVVGILIAIAFGWSWPGLLHFVISRAAGDSTARITGKVSVGTYAGNALAPFTFGIIHSASDTIAWVILSAMLGGAALISFLLSKRLGPSTFDEKHYQVTT